MMNADDVPDPFGGFSPQSDEDAAAKLALVVLATDDRVDDLVELLTPDDPVGALEGDPGWLLERRDDGDTAIGYADWPEGASYRARVDPGAYRLAWPERYYDKTDFHRLVRAILDAYLAHRPHQTELVARVAALLSCPDAGDPSRDARAAAPGGDDRSGCGDQDQRRRPRRSTMAR